MSAPSSGSHGTLDEIVHQLCETHRTLVRPCDEGESEPLPSRGEVVRIVEALRAVLFPGYFSTTDVRSHALRYLVGHVLAETHRSLEEQIRRSFAALSPRAGRSPPDPARAHLLAERLVERLPEVQRLLAGDVQAAFDGDPAATTLHEPIFCYPGIAALTYFRIAHELHQLRVPLLPRMITEQAHGLTGIDIHPGATIGERLFIDHGTGVVIGETACIGNGVRIYQGVTLGARSFALDSAGRPIKGTLRHPIIEDDVVIYSGATILGRVTVGRGSIIGGNVWLTQDVPPMSRITAQVPRRELFGDGGGI